MTAEHRATRGIGSRLSRWLLGLSALGTGLFLVNDAGSFFLMPPTPARIMGCYTALELMCGVTKPSLIRPIELLHKVRAGSGR